MRLHVLFGQRKGSYSDEYAPEALEVMDEYGYEENAAYLHDKYEAEKVKSHWASLKIIAIDVDSAALNRLLNPASGVLSGEIKET